MKNNRFDFIDIYKFILCIFIVAIHTAAFSELLPESVYYYLLSCVFKIAVPSFFVISGFFFGKKIFESTDRKSILKRYVSRLIVPLLFWEIVNIIIEVAKQLFIKKIAMPDVIINVIKSVLFYPYGALWYIQALIIALIIVYFALKKNSLITCVVIGLVFYLVGLFSNTYYFLVKGTVFQRIIDLYLKIFVSSRNAIFVGLFFVSIGVLLAREYKRLVNIKYKSFLTLFAYALLVLEVTMTKGKVFADDKSMFLSFIILIPLSVLIISSINYNNKRAILYRNLSSGVYFMHKAVLHVWLIIYMLINVKPLETIQFLVVLTSCILICLIMYRIDNKFVNKLVK